MPTQIIYITIALLVIAILPLPIAMDEVLRIVVTGTFGWGAYKNFMQKKLLLPLVYSLFVILFNPISEIVLQKELWIGINLVAAALLLITKKQIAE